MVVPVGCNELFTAKIPADKLCTAEIEGGIFNRGYLARRYELAICRGIIIGVEF